MAGTKAGAMKAKKTIKENHGDDFYKKIGRKGGLACVSKGFSKNKDLASRAGRAGGKKTQAKLAEKRNKAIKELRKEFDKLIEKVENEKIQV